MPDATGLTCQELVELVTEYLEGTIAPEDRRLFDLHLTHCRHCREYLAQMRRTIATLGGGHLPLETIPPHALAELERAFRDWKASS